jgi:hypothetical protein
MLLHFFDSSALVKYYQYERGTECVEEIVSNPINRCYILKLGSLEFTSTIAK